MRTAQQLRNLLAEARPKLGFATEELINELVWDLIARREADETRQAGIDAEALRARILPECGTIAHGHDAVTLTHRPTGLTAAAPRRDDALDMLAGKLRESGYLASRGWGQS